MLIDLNKTKKFQFIENKSIAIIGSGISGIFLAYLLRKMKNKIIVIEKGGIPTFLNHKIEFTKKNFVTGLNNKSFNIKNKFFGGWSNYWGGLLTELRNQDLKKKYWGLEYKSLKKLYQEVYDLFDINIHKINLKKKSSKILNGDLERYLCFYLNNPNFYYRFENFIKTNQNVFFYYNCNLYDVLTENNSIKYLIYQNKFKKRFKLNAKIFCISMGVKGNNQFLLSLKKNNPNFLSKHKQIGKFILDHIGIDVGKVEIKNLKKFRFYFENGFLNKIKYQPKLLGREGNLSMSAQFEDHKNFNKNLSSLKNFVKNLLNLRFSKFDKNIFSLKTIFLFVKFLFHFLVNRRILNFFSKDIRLRIQSEQSDNSYSRCLIDEESANKKNYLKKVKLDWHINKYDFKKINLFTNRIDNFLKVNKLGKILKYNLKYKNFMKNLESTYHLSGGTIVSKNVKEGVCNKNYKVWGVDNLYIAGSSLFPSIGSANITLTILALTLKLSKILKSGRS